MQQLCYNSSSVRTYLGEFFTPAGTNDSRLLNNTLPLLGVNVFKKMLIAMDKNQVSCFDAHVQDNGCERIAMSIYKLIHSVEMRETLATWKNSIDGSDNQPQNSENIKFLAGCYFLRQIRDISKNQFVIKLDKIDIFANNIPRLLKKSIVEKVQIYVSKKSAGFVQEEAELLSNCMKNAVKIKELCLAANLEFKDERYFSDSFYVGSLLIYRVQELQAPVLIKRSNANQRPFGFLCQSKVKGGALELVESKPLNNPTVVVFEMEGFKGLDLEGFKSKFFRRSITDVLLYLSASSEKKYASHQEVQEYATKREELNLKTEDNLDHFYCSTLEEEETYEKVTIYDNHN